MSLSKSFIKRAKYPVFPGLASDSPDSPMHSMQQLWAVYSDNSARHAIALARHLQINLMQMLTDEAGYDDLRLSFGAFIASLVRHRAGMKASNKTNASAGLRPSQLAGQLGISKQACNQVLNQLDRYGYICRIVDPDDGRARLLQLTPKGVALSKDGQMVIGKVELEYRKAVCRFTNNKNEAKQQFSDFIADLVCLAEALSLFNADFGLEKMRPDQILGAVLPALSEYISRQLMGLTMAKGHPDIAMSHGQVLTLIGLQGGRIQSMANIYNISKQAMSVTANELERLGYITRRGLSGIDGARSSLLIFTDRGWQLIADSIDAVEHLEKNFSKLLGEGRLARFKKILSHLYHALRLEEEVFSRPLTRVLGSTVATGENLDLTLLAAELKAHLGVSNVEQLVVLLKK